MLRKRLLHLAKPGAVYVPFCGDGDIAALLYTDRRVLGADLDPARVQVASDRLRGADIRVADCDRWPFTDATERFAVADFDAYSHPYSSFLSFWAAAKLTERLVLFFTDGHRQGVMRTGWWHKPDGSKQKLENVNEKRNLFNFYFPRYILPWFEQAVRPYRVQQKAFYLRGMMLYWGAVIENA